MFHKYLVLLRMKYLEMFAYRLATLVWLFGAMVQPVITMMVWMNIYQSQANAFILYFITLIFVERCTSAWDVWELDHEIREGTFSYQIVRPYHPIHWSIAENLIYKGLFLVFLIPAWIVLAIFLPVLRLRLTWSQGLLFLLALLLAAVLRFTLSYIIGLLGFWVTKVTAIYGTYEVISLFFSGRIAPLALLPPLIREISYYLPFRYMIGFPIEIITGAVKGEAIAYGFLGAIGWTLIFTFTLSRLWHAGLKRNQAVGG